MIRLLLAVVLLSTASWGQEEQAQLRSSSVLLGQATPRLKANCWADWAGTLENPTSEDVDLRLALEPRSRTFVSAFQSTVTVPAEHALRYIIPITAAVNNRYTTDSYLDGKIVHKELSSSGDIFSQTLPADSALIWLIRNDHEIAVGSLGTLKTLRGSNKSVTVLSERTPVHWSGYDSAHLVALVRPDYSLMSQRQIEALRDYVARGGCLIFIDPVAVWDAQDSPLSDLLPAEPLRLTAVEEINELADIGGLPMQTAEGLQAVLCAEDGPGYTSLRMGEYPLVRWRKYGLGTIGMCAISPHKVGQLEAANYSALWRHFLAWGGQMRPLSSTPAPRIERALDQLTGIRIPSTATISRLVFAYTGFLVLLFLVGYVTKRRLAAWCVAVVVSGFATALIFRQAANTEFHDDERLQSVLSVSNAGTPERTTESFASLFVQREAEVTVCGATPDERLRAAVPRDRSSLRTENRRKAVGRKAQERAPKDGALRARSAKPGAGLRDPLLLSYQAGTFCMPASVLRTRASRRYVSLNRNEAGTVLVPPEFAYTATGGQLQGTPPAAGFSDKMVLLTTASARVAVPGEPWQLAPLDGTSPFQALVRGCSDSWHASPLLAYRSREPGKASIQGFAWNGVNVELLGLTQVAEAGPIRVDSDLLRIYPANRRARLLRDEAGWTSIVQSAKSMDSELYIKLPPMLTRLQVSQVELSFAYSNRGKNIDFLLCFVSQDGTQQTPAWKATTSGSSTTLSLNDPQWVDPSDGHMILRLTTTQKQMVGSEDAPRVNAWRVESLHLTVHGALPAGAAGRL